MLNRRFILRCLEIWEFSRFWGPRITWHTTLAETAYNHAFNDRNVNLRTPTVSLIFTCICQYAVRYRATTAAIKKIRELYWYQNTVWMICGSMYIHDSSMYVYPYMHMNDAWPNILQTPYKKELSDLKILFEGFHSPFENSKHLSKYYCL